MRILFLLPVLSDSYYQKRVGKLRDLGIIPSVYGFRREHYKGKAWDLETVSLGHIKHAEFFQRIRLLMLSVFKVRKAVKNHDVLYCFNLDMLFLGWIGSILQSKKIKMVYDVADIHKKLTEHGFLSSVLRKVEKFLLRRVSTVVVASPAYVDGYFQKIQGAENHFVVIENKVDSNLTSRKASSTPSIHSHSEHRTIGYFGMIRCGQSLRFLKSLINESKGFIRLNIRGVFLNTESWRKDFTGLNHAEYGGPFVYPDDLEEMYSSTDLVWAAHIHGRANTKWSVSNRFYQACYFKCPVIAQAGTQDAKRVLDYQIGCVIDLNNFSASMNIIRSIKDNQISRWKQNMHHMPEDVYTFTDEHKQLLEVMQTDNF